MISQGHRLPAKAIKKLLERGSRFNGSIVSLCYLKTTFPFWRAAIIASKKVSLKATQRNLAKRRMGEALREILKNTDYHLDLVVFIRSVGLQIDYQKDLELWQKKLS